MESEKGPALDCQECLSIAQALHDRRVGVQDEGRGLCEVLLDGIGREGAAMSARALSA